MPYPRIELHSLEALFYPVVGSLRLSFAMIGVDLRHSVGQLCVALSQVTDVQCLTVLLPEERQLWMYIVYPEVLEDIQRLLEGDVRFDEDSSSNNNNLQAARA